jgi:hypothetical protein
MSAKPKRAAMNYHCLDCRVDKEGRLCNAPGKYKIDAFAYLYAPGIREIAFTKLLSSDKKPYVALLRNRINRAARIATTRARIAGKDNSASRKTAQRLLKTLTELDKQTAWLSHDKSVMIAADLSRVFEATSPGKTVIPSVVEIIDNIRSIRDWHLHLQKGFTLISAGSNRADLFGRHFVEDVIDFHRHYTGKQPPANRASAFARLLASAWMDLSLPMPLRKNNNRMEFEDLVTYLGIKVETAIKRIRNKKTRS